MALKATILKATLNIADMDRHYYADHQLTIAQHPSETDLRVMIRLLAFALNAGDTLGILGNRRVPRLEPRNPERCPGRILRLIVNETLPLP